MSTWVLGLGLQTLHEVWVRVCKHCMSLGLGLQILHEVWVWVCKYCTSLETVQKERVSAEQTGVMRGVTIAQVLGTDMKKHFDITSKFQVSPSKRFSNRLLQATVSDPILQTCMPAMQQHCAHTTSNVSAVVWKVISSMADQPTLSCFHVCCCCTLCSAAPMLRLPGHAKQTAAQQQLL